MTLVLRPSLKRVTEVKIVTELCNQRAIRNVSYNSISNRKKIASAISNVMESVDQLPLPDSLKKDLSRIIRPIVWQIVEWFVYHNHRRQFLRLPDGFCWTPEGTIDRKRTAQMLVNDESCDPEMRYKLACDSCLEDQIPELWKRIPEERKQLYHSENGIQSVYQDEVGVFWTYMVNDDLSKLDGFVARHKLSPGSYYLYAFKLATWTINLAATKFFLDKLTAREKITHLVPFAVRVAKTRIDIYLEFMEGVSSAQIFHYLLLRMSEDDRKRVFEECPYESFLHFLEWPLQPLFMGLAERYVDLFRDNNLNIWLRRIILDRIDYKEFDYRYLFHGFWRLTPESYKRVTAEYLIQFSSLLESEEEDVLKTLFDEAENKGQLVLFNSMWSKYVDLVHRKRWRFLKWFLEMCDLSEETGSKLKDKVRERKSINSSNKTMEEEWDAFISLIEDVLKNKRLAQSH